MVWKNIRNTRMQLIIKKEHKMSASSTRLSREFRRYGVRTVFVLLVNILSLFVIGACMKMQKETVTFILAFMALRSYAGGWHCKRNAWCYLVSCLTIWLALLMCRYKILENPLLFICILFGTGIMLYLYAPVEHRNRLLNRVERRIFRRRTFVVFTIESVIAFFFMIANPEMGQPIAAAILFTGVGIYPGILTEA